MKFYNITRCKELNNCQFQKKKKKEILAIPVGEKDGKSRKFYPGWEE